MPRRMPKRTDERYGLGFVTIDDPTAFLDTTLRDALESEIERESWRPPTLPRVALEIMTLTQKPECSVDGIIRVLEQDPLIAGRVFKLAQSPLYAGAVKLTSLRQAVVRLGNATVRDLVVQVSLETKIFRHKTLGPLLEQIWDHSNRVALLARAVARMTPFESELAFLSGLLHDVGTAGALLLAVDLKMDVDVPVPALLGAATSLHEKLGAKLVSRWGLSHELAFAVQAHHTLYDAGMLNPHAAILIVAESLDEPARQIDLVTPAKLAFEATQALGLTDHSVKMLIQEAAKLQNEQAA